MLVCFFVSIDLIQVPLQDLKGQMHATRSSVLLCVLCCIYLCAIATFSLFTQYFAQEVTGTPLPYLPL